MAHQLRAIPVRIVLQIIIVPVAHQTDNRVAGFHSRTAAHQQHRHRHALMELRQRITQLEQVSIAVEPVIVRQVLRILRLHRHVLVPKIVVLGHMEHVI